MARAASAWALRCLGCLARIEGNDEEALAHYDAALALRDDVRPLAAEACGAMLASGEHGRVLEALAGLAPALCEDGRLQLLGAAARLRMGDLDAAEAWLRSAPVIADVREGEILLTDLWFELHELRLAGEGVVTDAIRERARVDFPPPRSIDFRMRGSG